MALLLKALAHKPGCVEGVSTQARGVSKVLAVLVCNAAVSEYLRAGVLKGLWACVEGVSKGPVGVSKGPVFVSKVYLRACRSI